MASRRRTKGRRSSGRRRAPAVAPPPLIEQLEALLKRLRARHPELLGLGLGFRTRRGRHVPETVVKLQVRAKVRRPTTRVRFFPKTVPLRALVLGQVVTVRVPTDVEIPQRTHPTRFAVDGMRASALARWRDASGADRWGVVTAAHGLPAAGGTVSVRLADGTDRPGTVVAVASIAADGFDVGLVDPGVPSSRLADAGPSSPPLASADELLALLSSSPSDAIGASGESWSAAQPTALVALAFLLEWEWQGVPGKLRRVVQSKSSKLGAFKPGTSGSAWVCSTSTGRSVAALQSHGHKPNYQIAEGTHFASAVEWLRAQPGLADLRVAWRVQDLA